MSGPTEPVDASADLDVQFRLVGVEEAPEGHRMHSLRFTVRNAGVRAYRFMRLRFRFEDRAGVFIKNITATFEAPMPGETRPYAVHYPKEAPADGGQVKLTHVWGFFSAPDSLPEEWKV